MQVPASQFETRLPWVHLGRRHGPDDRLVRAVPAQEDRARRRRVAEAVWLHPHLMTGLAERHASTVQERVEPRGGDLRPCPATGVPRQPPEREHSDVLRSHDVIAEPRAPELDEGRVLPAAPIGTGDARVDRKQRGTRRGVLQAGPRGPAE